MSPLGFLVLFLLLMYLHKDVEYDEVISSIIKNGIDHWTPIVSAVGSNWTGPFIVWTKTVKKTFNGILFSLKVRYLDKYIIIFVTYSIFSSGMSK